MKHRNVLKSVMLGLAVLALATLPPSASASVIGHLSVGNCAGGGVIVTAPLINWELGSPVACLQAGLGTDLFSNGVFIPVVGPIGTINDLPGIPGVTGFMTFPSTIGALAFNLAPVGGFDPGAAYPDCTSSPAIGFSCTITAGLLTPSPFILTTTSTGTAVTLLAHGDIFDPTDGVESFWQGAFTTQINGQTPLQIRNTIVAGGSISSTYSGEFDVVVPEPVSLVLIGAGLIALAAIKRRKLV